MKLKNFTRLLIIFSLSLVACNSNKQETILNVGDEIKLLDNVDFDYNKTFFDDFSNGVNKDNWYIGDQAWGGANGGVIPENVSYTDDGILLLRGNGGYYQQNEVQGVGDVKDGRYTGAALISNFLVGPGRYEIKMKVLPRIGACTAFWTYAYEFDNELNHEIDIEIPGGNRSGNVTFENVLNTNYIKETRSQSQDTKISTLLGEDELYLNDGNWHTLGFDWYTNPEKIVYYIDNTICAISENFIPTLSSRLWVGVWFPVSSAFVGAANFETDYMSVDYISYIPFKDQPYTEYSPSPNGYANDNEYPTTPSNNKTANKVANGTFEYITDKNISYSGWILDKYLYEDKDVSEVCYINEEAGIENSRGLVIKDGGIAEQKIDAVYHNFKHNLSFKGKGKGKVTVNYYSTLTSTILNSYSLDIDSEEFLDYSLDLVAPKDSQSLSILFDSSSNNSIQIDNVYLYQK